MLTTKFANRQDNTLTSPLPFSVARTSSSLSFSWCLVAKRWWQSDWMPILGPVGQWGILLTQTQTQPSGACQHNSYSISSVIPVSVSSFHVVEINTLYLARLNTKHDWDKISISVRFNRQIFWKLITPLWRSHSLWYKINLESDRDRRTGIYAI